MIRDQLLASLLVFLCCAVIARADEPKAPAPKLPAVFEKAAPESVEDLKAIEKQVEKVLEKVVPCTVSIRIGNVSGSGVIVDKEGHILTAGHVSGKPNRDCILIFPDGKKVKGKTLGANNGIDSGMVKITEKGDWPFIELGNSAELKVGQWVIACGHPGGYKTGRPPVVRLGRLLQVTGKALMSDCTIVGGDSGGPLFDMNGKVVGIHSRISGAITANIHVPVDTYRETWDRLAKAEVWREGRLAVLPGQQPLPRNQPQPRAQPGRGNGTWLGVQGPNLASPDGCRVTQVVPGSPADKAGIQVNDVIKTVDGAPVRNIREVSNHVKPRKAGDELAMEVQRGQDNLKLKVVLAAQDQANPLQPNQDQLNDRLNQLNQRLGRLQGLRGGLLPGIGGIGGLRLPLPNMRLPNLQLPNPDLRLQPREPRQPAEPPAPPRGVLGVQGDPESRECIITQVVLDSPAQKAGLKVGDIIRRVDGTKVEGIDEMTEQVGKKKPGEAVDLEVIRNGESITVRVLVGR